MWQSISLSTLRNPPSLPLHPHALTYQLPLPSRCTARLTVRTFNIRRNEKISCHVTVRGDLAESILATALNVKDGELQDRNFSETGNFGFGVDEHIDLGIKYDPSVGIYGMDLYVVLARRGYRVAQKKRKGSKVGVQHRITKEEAQKWFLAKFQDSRIKA